MMMLIFPIWQQCAQHDEILKSITFLIYFLVRDVCKHALVSFSLRCVLCLFFVICVSWFCSFPSTSELLEPACRSCDSGLDFCDYLTEDQTCYSSENIFQQKQEGNLGAAIFTHQKNENWTTRKKMSAQTRACSRHIVLPAIFDAPRERETPIRYRVCRLAVMLLHMR